MQTDNWFLRHRYVLQPLLHDANAMLWLAKLSVKGPMVNRAVQAKSLPASRLTDGHMDKRTSSWLANK